MSVKVERSPVKFELAERIAGHANAPKEALESIFEGAMKSLETISGTTFESSMKIRVWNAVSPDQLKILKEGFLFEFCNKILGEFNETQADEMLDEHKRTGIIRNVSYSIPLKKAYQVYQDTIIDSVINKANSMIDNWIPIIVSAVRKEGINLPEKFS
jgi:hypothetical protein